jgi:hypothetical protein
VPDHYDPEERGERGSEQEPVHRSDRVRARDDEDDRADGDDEQADVGEGEAHFPTPPPSTRLADVLLPARLLASDVTNDRTTATPRPIAQAAQSTSPATLRAANRPTAV